MTIARVSKTQSSVNLVEGSALYELTAQYNDLAEKFEVLLQKLDLDAGVTDTDYEATVGESKAVDFRETGAPTPS